MTRLCILLTFFLATAQLSAAETLIADFDSDTYGEWITDGTAFGNGPARGTLPRQMDVSGFRGERLVNTYRDGDKSTGTLTLPAFRIKQPHFVFLIGGGKLPGEVGIELLIDGESVRTATGPESETLRWHTWDVAEHIGKDASLRIFDKATGGWGHILVDHIIQTDTPRTGSGTWRIEDYRRSAGYYDERYRPQYHFSPELNWMNDPNGLVYHDGEYHLFYQHNPLGNSWGHMSWGHAVSRDLMHWEHLPIALHEEYGVMIFSGCCVVDHNNTSGFGTNGKPPMVAIYTGHGHGRQTQDIAYSNDNGRHWTKYAGNPIIDIGESDFRDPKVFWHEPTERWVMVVSLAKDKILVFYASDDLKNWTELSRFGPAGVMGKPNWECPDLFELPVEGEEGKRLWVLEADMGSGSIAGGSGGEYFVGHFDGTNFSPIQESQWVDYGRDFYAPVSWSDIPEEDGRRIWIGWFNNWQTCLVPTSPWRSCMSIPRTLSLRHLGDRYVMVQRPVRELQQSLGEPVSIDTTRAAWPPVAVTEPGDIDDMSFVLSTTLIPGTARSCGLRIRTSEDEFTEVGCDTHDGTVYVDRRKSGNVDFHEAFSGRHDAPVDLENGEVELQILIDRSTIEVFISDGAAVISDRIFPRGDTPVIEVFAGDETAKVTEMTIRPMTSVWRDEAK